MKRKPLTKIQKFARGKPCSLRTHVCRQMPENENVVLCHAPFPNRGGMRNHDEWGAPGCDRCHDLLDNRLIPPPTFIHAEYWMPAIREWQQLLQDAGLMTVGGKR